MNKKILAGSHFIADRVLILENCRMACRSNNWSAPHILEACAENKQYSLPDYQQGKRDSTVLIAERSLQNA